MKHKKTTLFIGVVFAILWGIISLGSSYTVSHGQSGQDSPLGATPPSPTEEAFVYLPYLSRLSFELSEEIPDAGPCKLPEVADQGSIGLGFPRYEDRMDAIGNVRAKVLFVDFPDSPATQTPAQAFSLISPGAPEFYDAISYGRMNYQLEPYFVWLRMSMPSTDYTFTTFEGHRAYIQEAVDLADPNVDFSTTDQVIVIANPDTQTFTFGPTLTASESNGITADGNTIANAVTSGYDLNNWGFRWLNHESGHSLGLVDLYAYESSGIHRFVGDFSMMGFIAGDAPEFLAYERWLLGWLDDTQIYCQQTAEETVYLTAIESEGGVKALMVPTGPNSLVAVESRRALGYDADLPQPGALVYTVDTSIPSGSGPIKVYPNDNPPYLDAPLEEGDSLAIGNVTIEVIASMADGDIVRVTVTE